MRFLSIFPLRISFFYKISKCFTSPVWKNSFRKIKVLELEHRKHSSILQIFLLFHDGPQKWEWRGNMRFLNLLKQPQFLSNRADVCHAGRGLPDNKHAAGLLPWLRHTRCCATSLAVFRGGELRPWDIWWQCCGLPWPLRGCCGRHPGRERQRQSLGIVQWVLGNAWPVSSS